MQLSECTHVPDVRASAASFARKYARRAKRPALQTRSERSTGGDSDRGGDDGDEEEVALPPLPRHQRRSLLVATADGDATAATAFATGGVGFGAEGFVAGALDEAERVRRARILVAAARQRFAAQVQVETAISDSIIMQLTCSVETIHL